MPEFALIRLWLPPTIVRSAAREHSSYEFLILVLMTVSTAKSRRFSGGDFAPSRLNLYAVSIVGGIIREARIGGSGEAQEEQGGYQYAAPQ